MLTSDEIRIILKLLEEKYGFGYSNEPEIGALQAKLSILLELVMKKERVCQNLATTP